MVETRFCEANEKILKESNVYCAYDGIYKYDYSEHGIEDVALAGIFIDHYKIDTFWLEDSEMFGQEKKWIATQRKSYVKNEDRSAAVFELVETLAKRDELEVLSNQIVEKDGTVIDVDPKDPPRKENCSRYQPDKPKGKPQCYFEKAACPKKCTQFEEKGL